MAKSDSIKSAWTGWKGLSIPTGQFSDSDVVRFWNKVDRSAGPDGCWPWLAATGRGGYGRFRIKIDGVQGHCQAHRVALALNSDAPIALALHECDNPPCCNPRHLRSGTSKENREDCRSRGRTARGEKSGKHTKPESVARGEANGNSRLTTDAVVDIRQRLLAGESTRSLSRAFNVGSSAIRSIRRGETWKHVRSVQDALKVVGL